MLTLKTEAQYTTVKFFLRKKLEQNKFVFFCLETFRLIDFIYKRDLYFGLVNAWKNWDDSVQTIESYRQNFVTDRQSEPAILRFALSYRAVTSLRSTILYAE